MIESIMLFAVDTPGMDISKSCVQIPVINNYSVLFHSLKVSLLINFPFRLTSMSLEEWSVQIYLRKLDINSINLDA
jgi:hypothetical protein